MNILFIFILVVLIAFAMLVASIHFHNRPRKHTHEYGPWVTNYFLHSEWRECQTCGELDIRH